MSVQIESGYYALVPQSAYSSIEDLPGGSDVTERLLTELGKSPTGCAIQDHATIAGLFWVWKMMDSGWVLLMFGDKAHRADSPGEAYDKCRIDLGTDNIQHPPLSVLWLGSVPSITVH